MKLNRITIEELCRNGRAKVLNYKGRLIVSDHIAQEYLFAEPCRLDAITILVCLRGHLDYVVNLEHYVVTESSILVNTPENIIQFRGSENLEAYAVLISSDLLKEMPYDMLQMANSYLPVKKHFHSPIQVGQIAPLLPFYELLRFSLSHNVPETDDIVKSLLQAFLLSVISLMRQHQVATDIDLASSRANRVLFEKFMNALSAHHQQERTVQFYADKLCVTPKYLSMAVKQYSGKSPSDWICEYVIAEAKSLLHYSNIPVQQVAFHLNFPSQSSFGKFFKQQTGISPLQYAKGGGND